MLQFHPVSTKYIFVTGGVCSSLGKGIAAASIGALLKSAGFSVFMMKLDPYLNVDPGTMSPFQHGECFVTDDGAETDLDLGHYERFIDEPLSAESSVSSGQIYADVLAKERRGDYLGGTIQIIPHITGAIQERIKKAAKVSGADIVIGEIGGTVGDIEGEPFLEAIRQIRHKLGAENTLFVHLTLLPYLAASKELKTKPTQASVRDLRRIGITPDIILARADVDIDDGILKKIALFCDVAENAVIPAPTVSSIYEVPLRYEASGMTKLVEEKLNLPKKRPKLDGWQRLNEQRNAPKKELIICAVGKYTDLDDAYISVNEALRAAGWSIGYEPKIVWADSEKLERKNSAEWKKLESADGILVPGGFGDRGIEGKIAAAKYARENKKPYLGLCLGMQIMVIEFARHMADILDATSEEFESIPGTHVIAQMADQKNIKNKGGTMRLGSYSCQLVPNSIIGKLYAPARLVHERHRHRFEVNNKYRTQLKKAGLCFSGMNSDLDLVEMSEVKGHPFMVGTQAHPELKSRPMKPHPLFCGFVKAATKH